MTDDSSLSPLGTALGAPLAGAALDDLFREIVEERIPFNRLLGVRLGAVDRAAHSVELLLALKEEHIGNAVRGIPHGGLLAALIDGASGTAAALTLEDLNQVATLATLDMRVDYLRPARGQRLRAVATVMRSGRSVVVVRTDVFDDDDSLVALGTNTFTLERAPRP